MYKKQEKDSIYDPSVINLFNINTTKIRKLNNTWNQHIFTVQKLETSKVAEPIYSQVYGTLSKLGNSSKAFATETIPFENFSKHENNFPEKILSKEEKHPEKLWDLDPKITKKAEESKKILEKSSMISLKTKQKFEELEEKIAKLKHELDPLNVKNKMRQDRSAKLFRREKLNLPNIRRS